MLTKILPFIEWFKDYSLGKFRIDFLAGLTVALVLIPQSMAYAQLAGLPAYYGLYAAFLPPMIASLFGSSRQLATGPVAVVSLMTAASLEPLASAGSEAFIAYAIILALTVGVFQLLLGVLRLGLIVNFLSHPVVNGFTNAAAIIIATSQLSKLFGVYVDKAHHHYETIIRVIESAFHYTHLPTLAMGILSIAIMVGLKRLNPKIPYVLVAVAVTTIISWTTGFQHNATVTSSQIMDEQVQQDILSFNNAIKSIADLSDERTKLTSKIENSHDAPPLEQLDLGYQSRVFTAKIDAAKSQASQIRTRLREIHFSAVEDKNQGVVFYPKDGQVPEPRVDDRIYRILMGNKALDTQALRLSGGGAVVGEVPKGLPKLGMPAINISVFLQLLPYAIIISLLGFMEAIAIAKAMAAKTGQRLDPNQELIGQGLSNIIGSFGKSYPVSGSFSRSAVNLQAGAVSGFSSVITSLMVIITLLFFTPLLYHLPQAVLASVIMMAVIGLVNISGFVHAWKAQWYDGLISVITFVVTLAVAPHLESGIYVGVGLSLAVFLYKSMRPKISTLSRGQDQALKDSCVHALATCEHIQMIRFEGPLFFANASYLEDEINDRIQKESNLKHFIIACNGINDIDASGQETLALIIQRLRSAGYGVSLSGVNDAVYKVLARTHLLEEIGTHNIYPTMEKALSIVHGQTHANTKEDQCPLLVNCLGNQTTK
ncbi:sodium-independent anion transporter [Desulfobacter hydrogenophilus]|uniref:Sodium-independent anion transporter n=1 Tax=Desulfobacter hydrogenophilus TaxID=2291 RepID=A0A328FAQ0_9BACT|nr:SulP family inorganic anion transporter [Desulfobacter hydrogenophilus]NDY73329.1 SulP family inorganic anion transporter [Desulfobacter hydrogenophilus]QBH14066.1 SulP family inorganic anion transporter [Desulfobacter hydrogenophilus]RAM01628.1 sodium-independent anion transporter [Desulfobacter hydrogenophilus]